MWFTKANKPADSNLRLDVIRDIHVTGSIERAIHVDRVHYNDSPNPSCPLIGNHPLYRMSV
jgi:hypothetical protein